MSGNSISYRHPKGPANRPLYRLQLLCILLLLCTGTTLAFYTHDVLTGALLKAIALILALRLSKQISPLQKPQTI